MNHFLKGVTLYKLMSYPSGPEQLTELLTGLITSPGMQIMQTSLDQEDNEMITQMLLTVISTIICTPFLRGLPGVESSLIDGINIGFATMGYMTHIQEINRSDLKDYIYYSRLTPDGQLLRSNYHPINLITFMDPGQIPESFQKLYSDQNYLPNILNVWDRGLPDSLLLISFQKINIHVDRQMPEADVETDNDIQMPEAESELDVETDNDENQLQSILQSLTTMVSQVFGFINEEQS